MDEKLKPIKREFTVIKGTPKWIINQLKEKYQPVREKIYQNISTNIDNNTVTTTTHMLVILQKDGKGEKLIKSLNKHVSEVLTENHLSRHAYRKKAGFFFNIKDLTKLGELIKRYWNMSERIRIHTC